MLPDGAGDYVRMTDDRRLHDELYAASIRFDQVEHGAVFTVLESSALDRHIPGAHTKNLFLKDNGGQFYLVTVLAEKQVDLGALRHLVGAGRFSFGRADEMAALLGVTPGSVTPLAVINDMGGTVQLVLDEVLAAQPRVNVHPLRNTATLGLSGLDLVRLLVRWRHAPLIVPVPSRPPASAQAEN